MKKIVCIALVITMVFCTGAWTSNVRDVDNSELIEYLEDQEFTRRGDVWTNEVRNDGDVVFATIWFDVVDNRGLMTIYSAVDDRGYGEAYRTGRYVMSWDYEEGEMVILESEEYTR